METNSSHQKTDSSRSSSNSSARNTSAWGSTSARCSRRQQEQMFFDKFPTKEKVVEAFKPANWGKFLSDEEKCVKAPSVALGRLDSLYRLPGLAVSLVKTQIMGIYTLSAPNGSTPNPQAMDMTATMFVASNKGCGIYEAALYFAGYQGSYKSKRSYTAFDTGDLLSAFRTNFLPYWQQLQGKYYDRGEQPQKMVEVTGKPALQQYISESVEKLGGGNKGINAFMQQSGMVRTGYLTREYVEAAVAESNRAF